MTRTVVNGSPASAIGRRRDGRIGHPGGCRTERSEADGRLGARAASVTWSVISDWFTRDCRVYRSDGAPGPARAWRTNLHLPDIAFPRDCGMLGRPGEASGDGLRSAVRRNVPPHEQHDDDGLRSDPDRTDHRPRATGRDTCRARPLPGLGRHRRPVVDAVRWLRRAAIGLALVLTFSVGIGVGTSGAARLGRHRIDDPGSRRHPRRRTSGSFVKPGTPCTRSTSARISSTTATSSTAPSTA